MLIGHYHTFETKSKQSGSFVHNRSCTTPTESETIHHILSECTAYDELRSRIVTLSCQTKNRLHMDTILKVAVSFCQLILDPASMNLVHRINVNDPQFFSRRF